MTRCRERDVAEMGVIVSMGFPVTACTAYNDLWGQIVDGGMSTVLHPYLLSCFETKRDRWTPIMCREKHQG